MATLGTDPQDYDAPYPLEAIREGTYPIALETETMGMTDETNIPVYWSACSIDFGPIAGPSITQKGYDALREIAEGPRPKVFHNAKADIPWLKRIGIDIEGEVHDTILMHNLLDPHHARHHKLNYLAEELLHQERYSEDVDRLEQEQRKYPKGVRNMRVPQDILHEYAKADARDTYLLFNLFGQELLEWGMWDSYRHEVECALAYMKVDAAGIAFDITEAQKVIAALGPEIEAMAEKVYEAFDGERWNLNAPRQNSKVLSKYFHLTEMTDKAFKYPSEEGYKTGKDELIKFVDDSRIQKIFAHRYMRDARKQMRTYCRAAESSEDRRIHPNYNQLTVTGRARASEPNTMHIPNQKGKLSEMEVGDPKLAERCAGAFRSIRRAFTVPPQAVQVACDYSQVEYRCLAHYAGSERLIRLLADPEEDFHRATCLIVFEDYDERLRHKAKIVNYGILYGMGKTLLRKTLEAEGITNAQDVLYRYESGLPEMRDFQNRIRRLGDIQGWVREECGRVYFPDPKRPYTIVSYLCQGSAATIKKTALVKCQQLLDDEAQRSKLCLDVHDELVFEFYEEDVHLLPQIKTIMENWPQYRVPIVTDMEIGFQMLDREEIDIEQAPNFARKLIREGRNADLSTVKRRCQECSTSSHS